MSLRYDYDVIANWIEPGERVLDLGCGDGSLLRHLGELSKGTLGGVGSYVDRVLRMATDRNVMQEEANDLAERWRKWAQKNRRESAELADLMHDTTIVGVDPSKAYEPLRDEKTAGPGIAGEAITPAAQTTVRAAMRSSPTVTPARQRSRVGAMSPRPSCMVAGVDSKVLMRGWPFSREMR